MAPGWWRFSREFRTGWRCRPSSSTATCVVSRAVPFQCTTDWLTKFVPVSVKVKAGLPSKALVLPRLVNVGELLGALAWKAPISLGEPTGRVVAEDML